MTIKKDGDYQVYYPITLYNKVEFI
jgi:hypothetical protein